MPYHEWNPSSFSPDYLVSISNLPIEETALKLYTHAHGLLTYALEQTHPRISIDAVDVDIISYRDDDGWSTLVSFCVPIGVYEAVSLHSQWLTLWVNDSLYESWIHSCSFSTALVGRSL